MKHVWKRYGVGSEIGNALNRLMATDKRWKRKAVSRGSVVTSANAFRFVSGTPEHWAIMGPRVSTEPLFN